MPDTKQCRKCGELKDISAFSKHKSSKDGIRSICRECQSTERKVYYQENKDVEIARAIEWRANNLEKAKEIDKRSKTKNKEKVSQRKKDWVLKNRDKVQSYQQEYYKENRECFLAYQKQYYEENKDTKIKEYNLNNKDKI